jgi:hypothetical protein
MEKKLIKNKEKFFNFCVIIRFKSKYDDRSDKLFFAASKNN